MTMTTLVHGPPLSKAESAERSIVCILLFHSDSVAQAIEKQLEPLHFLDPLYQAIYRAQLAQYQDGQDLSFQSVHARMEAQQTAALVPDGSGAGFLAILTNELLSPEGLGDYIKAVKLAHRERSMRELRERLADRSLGQEARQRFSVQLQELQRAQDELLADADGWPGDPGPPLPLDEDRLPPWPEGVLTGPLAEHIEAVARFVQVPRELPAMVGLGILSACWAGKVVVSPSPGYVESLSLYCISIAPVGERKSAVYSNLDGPFAQYEHELAERLKPLHSDYQADKAHREAVYRQAVESGKRFERGTPEYEDARELVRRAKRDLDELQPPPSAEFRTQDTTAEGLARLMSQSGGLAVITSPEGGGLFDGLAGRYSELPNLDLYLKGYDGEAHVVTRSDRSREPGRIARATLVIALTTQPETLRRLTHRPELVERGLVARMVFSVIGECNSLVGHREPYAAPIPDATRQRYESAILTMLRVPRPDVPHVLQYTPEARDLAGALAKWVEQGLRPQGELCDLKAWAAKLPGKVHRIAALLHLAEHHTHAAPWTIPVGMESYRRATMLLPYLTAHARVAVRLMTRSPQVSAARRVLEWLERERRDTFTTHDAHYQVMRNARNVEAVREVLKVLADRNHICKAPSPRRDSERWRVHPDLIRTWQAAARPPAA